MNILLASGGSLYEESLDSVLLVHHSSPLLLLLLNRVLFSLAIAATQALGGQALVAKGGPRAKVLATLAPLDLQS